jgi:hypothetical protein
MIGKRCARKPLRDSGLGAASPAPIRKRLATLALPVLDFLEQVLARKAGAILPVDVLATA